MSTNLPEIVVFKDANFGGDSWRTNLDYSWVGSDWNDSISSLIVVSGTWRLYENIDYNRDGGAQSNLLTPGYYPWVEDPAVNMANDSVSSFQVISFDPDGV
jgi:Beta/Gamma crystallin